MLSWGWYNPGAFSHVTMESHFLHEWVDVFCANYFLMPKPESEVILRGKIPLLFCHLFRVTSAEVLIICPDVSPIKMRIDNEKKTCIKFHTPIRWQNKNYFTKTLEMWILQHPFPVLVYHRPQGYCGEGGEDSKGTHLSASGLSPAGNRYKARFPSSRATPARDLGRGHVVLISWSS